jgi:hypothetical protein
MRLTRAQITSIIALRNEIREGEGGGGMCHFVSEALSGLYGWERIDGTYTTRKGEVICGAHLWNKLPNGILIDATADQFGEGHDIRVLHIGDPEYSRYRPSWNEGWNPDLVPDCPRHLGYSDWAGELDENQNVRLKQERGRGWWLDCSKALMLYDAQRKKYAEAYRERYPSRCR